MLHNLVTSLDRVLGSVDDWMTMAIQDGTALWIFLAIVLAFVVYTRRPR